MKNDSLHEGAGVRQSVFTGRRLLSKRQEEKSSIDGFEGSVKAAEEQNVVDEEKIKPQGTL